MAPSTEDVRTALEILPINIVRKIIDEEGIDFKSRKSDELTDKLIEEVEWTEDRFEELLDRVERVQREKQPYGRYVCSVESTSPSLDEEKSRSESVVETLKTERVQFNERAGLECPGFELLSASEPGIEGIYWTESESFELTPRRELKQQITEFDTGFSFDFEDSLLFIDCSLPAKAKELRSKLDELDITTGGVSHEEMANTEANRKVQDFIDNLQGRLEETNNQESLGEGMNQNINVDLVQLTLDESDLQEVTIGGTDIMENEEVQRFQDDHDSRIVMLDGQLRYSEHWFDFKVGYTEGMGRIRLEKKGRAEERPELVEQAFEFVIDIYRDHFMDA